MNLSHARNQITPMPTQVHTRVACYRINSRGKMGNSTVGHTQRTETETLLTLPLQLPNLFLVLVILNLRPSLQTRTESVLLKLNLAKP